MEPFPEICDFFSLGRFLLAEQAGGYANRNYHIETSQGRYFVKFVMEHSRDELQSEQDYLHRIAQAGISVTPCLKGKDSSQFYTDGSAVVTVARYVEGRCLDELPVAQVISLAALAARVHCLHSNDLPPRNSWWQPDFIASALAHAEPGVDAARYRIASQSYADLQQMPWEPLPVGIVHGDLSAHNVIVSAYDAITIVDWEETTISSPVLDLAYLAINHCYPGGCFSPELFRGMIESYETGRKLTSLEKECFHLAARYTLCTVMAWLLAHAGKSGLDPDLAGIFDWCSEVDVDRLLL